MDEKFLYQNKILKDRRKELRNNQTKTESLLWSKLKNSQVEGYKFTRQYSAGPYILDFYCPKLRLAIELDGAVHKERDSKLYDKDRGNYLKSVNIQTIRFWNSEVAGNIENVLDKIMKMITVIGATSPLKIRGD